jgi:methylenetetrahydrofolate dehydrogenase (NADP+)/methenyltetrahydrofolate cyclohydrolase
MLLKGIDVVNSQKDALIARVQKLIQKGVEPCLSIVRIGKREDDLAYERAALKRCEMLGIKCKVFEFDTEITDGKFQKAFSEINCDNSIHGLLLLRPIPKHINIEAITKIINPERDVDGISPENMAAVFAGAAKFAPCTAEAVMLLLESNNISLCGKRVVIIGRSMVVGKPLAMLMLAKNATVTICHTKTINLSQECRNADILIAAAGKANMITSDYVKPGAVVIDVGINVKIDGSICGDVLFENVKDIAGYITPIPGGVGTLTTLVLAKNVIKAAELISCATFAK